MQSDIASLPGSASTAHANKARYVGRLGAVRKLKAAVDYPIGGKPTYQEVQANSKAIAVEQRRQGQLQRLKADRRAAKREANRAKRRHVPVVVEQLRVPMDPFSTLDVSPDADLAIIKRSYKRLAMKYHPDKNPHSHQAEKMFKLIHDD